MGFMGNLKMRCVNLGVQIEELMEMEREREIERTGEIGRAHV